MQTDCPSTFQSSSQSALLKVKMTTQVVLTKENCPGARRQEVTPEMKIDLIYHFREPEKSAIAGFRGFMFYPPAIHIFQRGHKIYFEPLKKNGFPYAWFHFSLSQDDITEVCMQVLYLLGYSVGLDHRLNSEEGV